MADFAPNHTPRVKVTYELGGRQHSVTARHHIDVTPVACANAISDLILACDTFFPNSFQVQKVESAAINENFFLPLTGTDFDTVTYTGQLTQSDTIFVANDSMISFTGKTTRGNPWKMFLYGFTFDGGQNTYDANWRLSPSEVAGVGTILNLIESHLNDGLFIGIDRNKVILNRYINVAVSAYWIRKSRRSN